MKRIGMLWLWMPMVAMAATVNIQPQRPADFVVVKKVIPQIQLDMRYATDFNFVGKKIRGYEAPVCLLTRQAALALKNVEDRLLPMGLTLKVYDCYRPQTAVNHFAEWAKALKDTAMQKTFYPNVDKSQLFSKGYIDYHSGHSRGSTMDLTIVPVGSPVPVNDKAQKQVECTEPASQRAADNSLNFGTGFDCFSPVSHPDYQNLSGQEKANRLLLQQLMVQAGFNPVDTEWWHFALRNEPYPDTYFDFPVRDQ